MPLSSELTLASSPRAAADARRWVGEICQRLERPDLIECAELGVSELVANAILHAAAPYKVRVRATATHPRIEVMDGSTRPPEPPSRVESAELDLLLTFGRGARRGRQRQLGAQRHWDSFRGRGWTVQRGDHCPCTGVQTSTTTIVSRESG